MFTRAPLASALAVAAALALTAAPAAADDVTEAINNALEAYNEGDTAYAAEELTFALQLLNEMKADGLSGFLPDPMEGWERQMDDSIAAGMSMMGGGIGAGAEYENGGSYFSITIMADSPMVAALGGMLGNAAMITASGGKMVRVGREKFMQQDEEVTGLIGGRVLVQASGDDVEAIIAHLETMDFNALEDFGQ
ncbi:MAG: hypothetical protein AAF771_09425 [Pseudomonadota bacterium]